MKWSRRLSTLGHVVMVGVFIALLPLASAIYSPQGQNPSGVPARTATTFDVQVGVNTTSFSPQQVTIHVGDTVRWTWVSDAHTVTSGSTPGMADGKFCSPSDANCSTPVAQNKGTVYQHTFTQAGTFPYFCAFHFAAGMTGTVIVQP